MIFLTCVDIISKFIYIPYHKSRNSCVVNIVYLFSLIFQLANLFCTYDDKCSVFTSIPVFNFICDILCSPAFTVYLVYTYVHTSAINNICICVHVYSRVSTINCSYLCMHIWLCSSLNTFNHLLIVFPFTYIRQFAYIHSCSLYPLVLTCTCVHLCLSVIVSS